MSVMEEVRRATVTAGVIGFLGIPALRREPFGLYRLLRRIDPVHHDHTGVVLLSRHSEVSAALRSPSLGSDEGKADPSHIRLGPLTRLLEGDPEKQAARRAGPFYALSEKLMLFLDPPDHTRLRTLVSKAFTPRVVERLEPRIGEVVDELLDRVDARGEMEVMRDLAYPLPAKIICELMGVPADREDVVVRAAPAVAVGLDPSPLRTAEGNARADRAVIELTALLDELITHRRRSPGDDLLSRLVAAESDGDRLTRDELLATIVLLLIAGHETTANLIGNGLLALARQPGSIERWRDDASLDRTAVEELLRHSGPVQMAERIALADVEVADARITAGRIVILTVAGANRDPVAFAHPDRLDLARNPNPHVAFGSGIHHCLGAPLARVEARVALTSLLRRFPGLTVDTSRPRWRRSFTLRGLERLDVRLR